MSRSAHDSANLRVQAASVGVAITLIAAKFWAFAATGALSVAASLADSGLDLLVSLAGLAAIRYAQVPPDEDHTFGHDAAEDIAAFVQSAFILISALAIAGAALARFGAPPELTSEGAGIAVMVLSIVLTLGLVIYQTRVARRTGNKVVAADRLHYIGDLLPNVGAIGALVAAQAFDVSIIDTLVALVAAGVMAVGSLRIGSRAWDALMDRAAPSDLSEAICKIAGEHPEVRGHHDLRTRTSGGRVFVNLHLEIQGTLTLHEAHDIGEDVRDYLKTLKL